MGYTSIEELRSLRTNYGALGITINVFHITNGDKNILSDEYIEESKILRDKYSGLGFEEFIFDQLGAYELIEMLNKGDKSTRKIDLELPVIYDVNRASMMEFTQGDTKSFVCTIAGSEIAKAAMGEPRDAIFDLNVRPYYGSKGKVNKDILNTCTGGDSVRFWFLNNGITMVCDSYDFTRDPDHPLLKIKNAQIVNGCQTTVTIREAHEAGKLDAQVRVLLRVYAIDDPRFVERITLTTNNQNKITDRDLRANDTVQCDIERIMYDQYKFYYERQNKQHRSLRGEDKKRIIPSPKAGQAYLAVVRAKPANARGYLGAIWSDFYGEIFENASVPDLILAYKIYQLCHAEALGVTKRDRVSRLERDTRVYGVFHIARVIGWLLLKEKWGHDNVKSVDDLLKSVLENGLSNNKYQEALEIVLHMRKEDEKKYRNAAMYFKNMISNSRLNAALRR